jgi:hypothetical protein
MKTKKSKIEAASTSSSLKLALGKAGRPDDERWMMERQKRFERRFANRTLSTEAILNYLRSRMPKQYEVAEVVGKWIWLELPAKGGIAATLWLIGFHWNSRRGVWQHPCGKFDPVGSHPTDPRTKYHSYFPADILPA